MNDEEKVLSTCIETEMSISRFSNEELLKMLKLLVVMAPLYKDQLISECLRRLMKHLIDTEKDHDPS